MVPLILLIALVKVLLLKSCLLALLLLDLLHELLDAVLEALLELLFRLCVLFEPVRSLSNSDLQLSTAFIALSYELLVFCNVLLQVIEYLEFFIKRDQSVKFVLELVFFLLEEQLELRLVILPQHRLRQSRLLVVTPRRGSCRCCNRLGPASLHAFRALLLLPG